MDTQKALLESAHRAESYLQSAKQHTHAGLVATEPKDKQELAEQVGNDIDMLIYNAQRMKSHWAEEHEKSHHFFAANADAWAVGESRSEAVEALRRGAGKRMDIPMWVLKVPLPLGEHYEVKNGKPVVEGLRVVQDAEGPDTE